MLVAEQSSPVYAAVSITGRPAELYARNRVKFIASRRHRRAPGAMIGTGLERTLQGSLTLIGASHDRLVDKNSIACDAIKSRPRARTSRGL